MEQQSSLLPQSLSSVQSWSALSGEVQTFGYDRSTDRQASPAVVSHLESSLQKRGQSRAGAQMLPASP
jgi:hypothetical protein